MNKLVGGNSLRATAKMADVSRNTPINILQPIDTGGHRAKEANVDKASTLASKVLSGTKKPTKAEVKTLAASVLGPDETKGKHKKK